MPLDPTLDELSSEQQRQMTHQAPQPNPAQPYLDAPFNAWKNFSEPIWSAMTTPPGMTPSDLEQQARTAADLGFNLTTGGVGAGTKFAEKSAIGIFGGGRGFSEMAARTGNTQTLHDLELAKQMEAQGMSRSQIRAAMEWFREEPSGIWNKEIFDNPATLNGWKIPAVANYGSQTMKVGEILNHPELYKVYPHLADMPITFKEDTLAYLASHNGSYRFPRNKYPHGDILMNNPHRTSDEQIKSTLLHELQHAVDTYEGRRFSDQTGLPIEAYFKLIEEARARNVQLRARYTPEQLKQESMSPWWTMRQMREPVSEMAVTMPPP